jgi:hypothetical protein
MDNSDRTKSGAAAPTNAVSGVKQAPPGAGRAGDRTPPLVRVPAAGKETEAREAAQIEELLEEIQEVEKGAPDSVEGGVERRRPEEWLEVRLPPEEEAVEVPPDLARVGVQAVPPVIPPQIGDDDQGVITLPLTEEEIEEGLHHKVRDSIRWLAEWCVKIAKMAHGRVKYATR